MGTFLLIRVRLRALHTSFFFFLSWNYVNKRYQILDANYFLIRAEQRPKLFFSVAKGRGKTYTQRRKRRQQQQKVREYCVMDIFWRWKTYVGLWFNCRVKIYCLTIFPVPSRPSFSFISFYFIFCELRPFVLCLILFLYCYCFVFYPREVLLFF